MRWSPTMEEWSVLTAFVVGVYAWAAWEWWQIRKQYRAQTRHEWDSDA